MIQATCIGHSHAACLAEAVSAAGAPVEVLNFWGLPGAVITEGDAVSLAPYVAGRLHAPVFSLVGGAVHYDVGLIEHTRPFDFIEPGAAQERARPGAELIPFAAVRRAMMQRTSPYLRIMDAVRRIVAGAMFHFQSPPVFEAETVHEEDPGWVAFYGMGRKVTPGAFRQKLWRLHSALVAEHCAANNIVFVPCPPQAFDANGYLRPEYVGKPAHTNAAYGHLVLNQLLTLS